ncbi:hypothetical protein PG997_008994 [Apiospora hydei]|uniref:Uncharacterized protein n=1 Tax=Apiospora hydei TaxID=1337664 RepID=A0ABR1WCF1_9PEZI
MQAIQGAVEILELKQPYLRPRALIRLASFLRTDLDEEDLAPATPPPIVGDNMPNVIGNEHLFWGARGLHLLEERPNLPESVIQETIARLKHPTVWDYVAGILSAYPVMSDERFDRLLREIDDESFKRLYRTWATDDREEIEWQAAANAEGVSVIRFPGGSRKVHLDSRMKRVIREWWEERGLPPHGLPHGTRLLGGRSFAMSVLV